MDYLSGGRGGPSIIEWKKKGKMEAEWERDRGWPARGWSSTADLLLKLISDHELRHKHKKFEVLLTNKQWLKDEDRVLGMRVENTGRLLGDGEQPRGKSVILSSRWAPHTKQRDICCKVSMTVILPRHYKVSSIDWSFNQQSVIPPSLKGWKKMSVQKNTSSGVAYSRRGKKKKPFLLTWPKCHRNKSESSLRYSFNQSIE